MRPLIHSTFLYTHTHTRRAATNSQSTIFVGKTYTRSCTLIKWDILVVAAQLQAKCSGAEDVRSQIWRNEKRDLPLKMKTSQKTFPPPMQLVKNQVKISISALERLCICAPSCMFCCYFPIRIMGNRFWEEHAKHNFRHDFNRARMLFSC